MANFGYSPGTLKGVRIYEENKGSVTEIKRGVTVSPHKMIDMKNDIPSGVSYLISKGDPDNFVVRITKKGIEIKNESLFEEIKREAYNYGPTMWAEGNFSLIK
ncbi:hypothetical protein JW899_03935 [Candidatus Uhrbacteria bacterium]|nr:hypothetical protein [Candidatus Uhrbacteria bacterium]